MNDHPFTSRQLNFQKWRTINALSFVDIADKSGVPYSTLKSFASKPGQGMIDRNVEKITKAFGISADVIFNDPQPLPGRQSTHVDTAPDGDKVQIHQLDLRFGMGGGAFYDAPVEATPMSFSRGWIRQLTSSPVDQLFWASGFGDSMYPTIGDGDIVLVDRSQTNPVLRDQIWALNQYGQGMIKRLRATEEGYAILSDNPQVPNDTAADGSMEVVGRVIAVVRRL